jgi:hypothetical protein
MPIGGTDMITMIPPAGYGVLHLSVKYVIPAGGILIHAE